MSMVIGTNVSSLTAQRSLEQSTRMMGSAMERLATGTKINSASDDAAGLALANRMSSQASSLGVAVKNMADGIALTEAIEGSLEEVTDILARMRSLAVQAASDTTAAKDRNTLNAEMSSLKNELTGLATRSTYAGQNVIDGSFTGKNIQVGTEASETIAISQSSVAATSIGGFSLHSRVLLAGIHATTMADARINASATADTFTITPSGGSATSAFAGTEQSAKEVAAAVNLVTGTTGVTATAHSAVQLGGFDNESVNITLNGSAIAATNLSTNAATFVDRVNQFTATTGVVASVNSSTTVLLVASDGRNIELERTDAAASNGVTVENLDRNLANPATAVALTGTGGATEFVAAKGQISLSASGDFATTQANSTKAFFATNASAGTSFVSAATLDSRSNASAALASIDGAIDKVSAMRADLGAISNRLTHAKDAAVILRENTEAGVSRLRDADYAQESANLAKAQVLQQVGTAMLAQANAQPQLVLQLVQ
jgi:flagellin